MLRICRSGGDVAPRRATEQPLTQKRATPPPSDPDTRPHPDPSPPAQ